MRTIVNPSCSHCIDMDNDRVFSGRVEGYKLRKQRGETLLDIAARPGPNVVLLPDPRDLMKSKCSVLQGKEVGRRGAKFCDCIFAAAFATFIFR